MHPLNSLVETEEPTPLNFGVSGEEPPKDTEQLIRGTALQLALLEGGLNPLTRAKELETEVLSKGVETVRFDVAKQRKEEEAAWYSSDYARRKIEADAVMSSYDTNYTSENQKRFQEDNAEFVAAARVEFARRAEEDARFALEQKTAERIAALSLTDPVSAELLRRNWVEGDALSVQADINAKYMIIEREVAALEADEQNQNILGKLAAAVLAFIPFRSGFLRSGPDVEGNDSNFFDMFLYGQQQRENVESYMNLPIDEFAKVTPEVIKQLRERTSVFGFENAAGTLNVYRDLAVSHPTQLESDIWGGVDILSVVPFGKVGSASKVLARGGARVEAVAAAAEEVLQKGVQTGTPLDTILPQALDPGGIHSSQSVGFGLSSSELIGKAEFVENSLRDTYRLKSDFELDKAVDSATKQWEELLGPYQLHDVKLMRRDVANSAVYELEGLIGRPNGAGFVTKRDASVAAERLGFPADSVVRGNAGNQWFVKSSKPITEVGFFGSYMGRTDNNIFQRALAGNRQLLDDFTYNTAQAATNTSQLVLNTLHKKIKKAISSVSSKELGELDAVALEGQRRMTWFNRDQFEDLYRTAYDRTPSDKEWSLYQEFIKLNDTEHTLRNATVYRKLHTAGYENVTIDNPYVEFIDQNAVVRSLETKNLTSITPRLKVGDRVFDIENGIGFNAYNTLDELAIQRYSKRGFVLVELPESIKMGGEGSYHNKILVRKENMTVTPLRTNQLPYKPGGHRFYRGSNFAKQGVRTQLDDGTRVLMRPNTYITGTKAEVAVWVAEHEEARTLLKNILKENPNADDVELAIRLGDEMGEGTKSGFDPHTFIKQVRDGEIDLDEPFENLRDRELPQGYTESSGWGFSDDDYAMSVDFGSMYTSRRGESLKDWKGQYASTLSPLEAIGRGLENVSRLTSFGDFKESAIRRWVQNYGHLTNMSKDFHSLSPERVFLESTFPDRASTWTEKTVEAAESQRQAIRSILGYRTKTAQDADRVVTNVVDWVAGDAPESVRHKWVHQAHNWFKEKDPVSFLSGVTFDAKLGMFNPGQLVVQLSGMLNTMALAPKHAVGSAMSVGLVSRALLAKDFDGVVNTLISRKAHELLGFEPDEFKNFLTSIKLDGILDIQGNHSLVGEFGPSATYGAFSKIDDIRQAGRFFFNTAERGNLISAYYTAWKVTRETHPKLRPTSNDFLTLVSGRAGDYSLNMSKVGSAAWQRNAFRIPFQFFAYNARMLEALVGRQFSTEQKLRLLVAQGVLYGSAGVPLGYSISQFIKENTDTQPSLGTAWGLLDRGFFDNMVFALSGGKTDIQIGSRMGSLSFAEKYVETLFGAGEFGEKSFMDIAGGASLSVFGQAAPDVVEWIKYATVESGSPAAQVIRKEAAERLVKNISTVSSALKATQILRYGTYSSNKGNVLIDGIEGDPGTVLGVLFGFAPGELADLSIKMHDAKEHQQAVEDAAGVYRSYRSRYLTEVDKREEIREEMSLFASTLPPDVRQQAIRRANKADKSLYSSVAKSFNQRKEEEERRGAD